MTRSILNEELKLEEIEKDINKIRFKIKKLTSSLNTDFLNSFKQFAEKIPREILDTLLEFFGYEVTPFKAIKVYLNLNR